MPTEFETVCTAGSITHIEAPTLITVEEAWFKTPMNIEVMNMIRKKANVIPTSSAVNLARSLTKSLYASLKTPFISGSNVSSREIFNSGRHSGSTERHEEL